MTGQLREVVLKLHQQLFIIQSIQLAGSAIRIFALALGLAITPAAWVAILVAGCVQAISNLPLTRRVARLLHQPKRLSPEVSLQYKDYVKRSLPSAIYYALAGQVNIFIISILGNVRDVAEVGVAGRIGAATSVITAIIGLLVVPRFARATLTPRRQVGVLYILIGLILTLGIGSVALLWLWPNFVHLLAGPAYQGIQELVAWSIFASILAITGGTAYHMSAVRGHVLAPSVMVISAVLFFAFSFLVVGAGTPLQVFQMNSLSSAGVLAVTLGYATFKLGAYHRA